jgi:thiol-disulfide isomerase/thioredoxin
LSIGWAFDYQYYKKAQAGTKAAANPKNEQTMVRTSFLTLDYQVTPRLSVAALVPLKQVTAPKDIRPQERVMRSFNGLGDVIVLGSYQLNAPEKPARPTFTAQFGMRFPTGKSQPEHTFSGSLSRDPVLQVGHGTFDPLFGFSCAQPLGRNSLSADVLVRLTGGTNRFGVKFGPEVQGSVGLARALKVPRAFSSVFSGAQVSVRVHGIKSGHDYDQGKIVQNTGGQWLYLLPGINFQTKGRLSYFFQFQLPVYQNVNGSQLVAPFGFTTGVAFNLRRRKEASRELAGEVAAPQRPAPALSGPEPEVISRGERVDLLAHLAPGRVTVFEFYADWCNACRRIDPRLKQLALARKDVIVKRIDIGDGETEVTKQYGIEMTPTFHVYSTEGKLVKVFSTDNIQELEAVIKTAQAKR